MSILHLEQARKSLLSRIARAKNNIPSIGRLPYGRTFDRKTNQWGIEKEKQGKIKWAAEQYLKGKSTLEIAKTLGMNHPNILKILRKLSGTEWTIFFDNKRLNITETITLEIPELLPQETIDAIHAKSESNKTYEHGHIKNKYLLSRMIVCSRCGYAMYGQTSHGKTRYYRHPRNLKRSCDLGNSISAGLVEQAVFIQLYGLQGDIVAIEKSMESSVDKYGDYQKLSNEVKVLKTELKSISAKKNNLINAIADGIVNHADIKPKMELLKEQQEKLEKEIKTCEEKIGNIPSPSQIKRRSKFIQQVLKRASKNYYGRGDHFLKMSWEDKRKLCELLFSGVDPDGKRAGVYIDKDEKGNWYYEIRGLVDKQIAGQLPMSELEIMDLLKIDSDDLEFKQDLLSKRDAHNGLCIYQR